MTIKKKYTKNEVKKLSNNKPVVYKIKTKSGATNYIGKAKRGRVNERIIEHMNEIPGSTVSIEQFSSIAAAGKKEVNSIKKTKPKYNKQGK